MALGFALAKGLFCLVTSLASRRWMHFGGEHIHKLFCLPPSSSGSPMAEQALTKLDHRNDKMLLLALEVLFVEEVSLISAEQWSAMDNTLQELKQSSLPFGGVLVIESGDQMQLPSIDGNDIFLSPVLLTNFALFFWDISFARPIKTVRLCFVTCGSVRSILPLSLRFWQFWMPNVRLKTVGRTSTIRVLCVFSESGKPSKESSITTLSEYQLRNCV